MCSLFVLSRSSAAGPRQIDPRKPNRVKTDLMETALLVALVLIAVLAAAGLAFFAGRQRAPVADTSAAQLAGQPVVELGARVQAMGELLAKAHTQLQSSVHERLDAVTQHLS